MRLQGAFVKVDTGTGELWNFAYLHRQVIDRAIEEALPAAPSEINTHFNEAVHRAIFPGGKRIRPVLALLAAELFGQPSAKAIRAAVAAEFIHTSSLIFDDFPGMDDADERRGEKCLHKRYGEGMATLVALSFLNEAYSVVIDSNELGSGQIRLAIREMISCIGPSGMIGGQAVDLSSTGLNQPSNSDISRLKNLKTSSLIRLALNLGAIYAGATFSELDGLTKFAAIIGDAYQKSDDILDLTEDEKRVSPTFVPTDRERIRFLQAGLDNDVRCAKEILRSDLPAGPASDSLSQLVDYIARREA